MDQQSKIGIHLILMFTAERIVFYSLSLTIYIYIYWYLTFLTILFLIGRIRIPVNVYPVVLKSNWFSCSVRGCPSARIILIQFPVVRTGSGTIKATRWNASPIDFPEDDVKNGKCPHHMP